MNTRKENGYGKQPSGEMSLKEAEDVIRDCRENPTPQKLASHTYLRAVRIVAEAKERMRRQVEKEAAARQAIKEKKQAETLKAKQEKEAKREEAKRAKEAERERLKQEKENRPAAVLNRPAAVFMPVLTPAPEKENERAKRVRLARDLDMFSIKVLPRNMIVQTETMELLLRIMTLKGRELMDNIQIAEAVGVTAKRIAALTGHYNIETAPLRNIAYRKTREYREWNTPERKELVQKAAERGYNINHQSHVKSIKMLIFIHDLPGRESMKFMDIYHLVHKHFFATVSCVKGILRHYGIAYEHASRTGLVLKDEIAEIQKKYGSEKKRMFLPTAEIMKKINALENIENMTVRDIIAATGFEKGIPAMNGILYSHKVPYKRVRNMKRNDID